MSGNAIFNATVCIIGIAIFLIHIVNLLFKKNRRKDENRLLLFLSFTAFHFLAYLIFTFIKVNYTSDNYIITFYTIFYIFNNLEAFFLFLYMLSYISLTDKNNRVLMIFNYVLLGIFIVLDIVNAFTGLFFTAQDGEYVRSKLMFLSQIYQFVMLTIVFVIAIINKKLLIKEKIAFAFYCALPLVAIIVQNALPGYAIAYASIIIAIEILFLFLNVQKSILLAEEQQKNKEAQIKLMMSQIQPHFIYNSLSTISTLITIDPDKAQRAIDDFTEYLRHNLSSISENRLIPFEDELEHIETYISLEKIRFNDRLNVVYDIKARDFNVPPLSIQPLVENAIKHGILKKAEGGTLTIKTAENEQYYIVVIDDDGVGFNVNRMDLDPNKHFGLNNIKYRLSTMCNATIDIESEINKGTTVVVKIKKEAL